MQNNYEITSTIQFWTRNVRNLSKSLTETLRKVDGKFTESPRPVQEEPYGPIWAHKGPYGPQPGPGPNPDWAPTRARASSHRGGGRRVTGGRPGGRRRLTAAVGWGHAGSRGVGQGAGVHAVRGPYGPLWAHMGPILLKSHYF